MSAPPLTRAPALSPLTREVLSAHDVESPSGPAGSLPSINVQDIADERAHLRRRKSGQLVMAIIAVLVAATGAGLVVLRRHITGVPPRVAPAPAARAPQSAAPADVKEPAPAREERVQEAENKEPKKEKKRRKARRRDEPRSLPRLNLPKLPAAE